LKIANNNYVQLVQVIILLLISPLWPYSTSSMRWRNLARWSWFFHYSGRRGRFWQHGGNHVVFAKKPKVAMF